MGGRGDSQGREGPQSPAALLHTCFTGGGGVAWTARRFRGEGRNCSVLFFRFLSCTVSKDWTCLFRVHVEQIIRKILNIYYEHCAALAASLAKRYKHIDNVSF